MEVYCLLLVKMMVYVGQIERVLSDFLFSVFFY